MTASTEQRQTFSDLKHSHPDWHNSIKEVFEEVVGIRRDLRQHPELAFEEIRTAAIVAEKLRSWGYEVQEKVGKTGVVGILRGNKPGPVAGLRADMDALPMMDEIDEPYRSVNDGLAHTCGHDAHTAILLGVAKVLAKKGISRGTLKLVFQPAEEIGAGAKAMIEDGALKNPQVEVMAGLHVHPTVNTGMFAITKTEHSCAAVDIFEMEVTGQGGHAAHPHKTVDPIVISGQVLVSLQQIVSRQTDPLDSVVISFGQIEAGTKATIIPNSVKLKGTVRTLNPDTRAQMPKRIEMIAKGIAASFGGDCSLDYHHVTPSNRNDPAVRDRLLSTIENLYGKESIKRTTPSMGGEDFSYYSEQVPSVFFQLGTNSSDDTAYPNHNTKFNVDEESFLYGISVLSIFAYNYLDEGETK
ncbi:M20 metallopeptidase family protein [Planococcus plakortidis]